MAASSLTLTDELADIRAEIARLQAVLASQLTATFEPLIRIIGSEMPN